MDHRVMHGLACKWISCLFLLLSCMSLHAQVTYVYTDPQGTPLAEADAQGNIIATYDYTPYGSQALGTPPNGPGYTGHVNDPDTGLVYMQARYYDPLTQRFLSTDPIDPTPGNHFNFNRYAYASNNPIVNTDPDGRQDEDGSAVDEEFYEARQANYLSSPPAVQQLDAVESELQAAGNAQANEEIINPGAEAKSFNDAMSKILKPDVDATKYTSGARFSKTTAKQTANNADNKCEYCGVETTPAQKSQSGVTPPDNEGQTDHVDPRSNGGSNSPDNAAHACRACNIRYSNTPKPHPRQPQPQQPPPPPPQPSTQSQ
jgi:RHS repeat-associated protein